MSLYHDLKAALDAARCPTCNGLGVVAKNVVGDWTSETGTCGSCHGKGVRETTDLASLAIGLDRRERAVLNDLSEENEIAPTRILLQALRVFQYVDVKAKSGRTMCFQLPDGTLETELAMSAPMVATQALPNGTVLQSRSTRKS